MIRTIPGSVHGKQEFVDVVTAGRLNCILRCLYHTPHHGGDVCVVHNHQTTELCSVQHDSSSYKLSVLLFSTKVLVLVLEPIYKSLSLSSNHNILVLVLRPIYKSLSLSSDHKSLSLSSDQFTSPCPQASSPCQQRCKLPPAYSYNPKFRGKFGYPALCIFHILPGACLENGPQSENLKSFKQVRNMTMGVEYTGSVS